MLIKFGILVINLDNVIIFYKYKQKSIKFEFNYLVASEETAYEIIEFESDEDRDFSFEEIIRVYELNESVCRLD